MPAANLDSGVASAMIAATDLVEGPLGGLGDCLRSTKRHCPQWPTNSGPKIIVLLNLFRDQLDRYGEVRSHRAIVARLPGTSAGRSYRCLITGTIRL